MKAVGSYLFILIAIAGLNYCGYYTGLNAFTSGFIDWLTPIQGLPKVAYETRSSYVIE